MDDAEPLVPLIVKLGGSAITDKDQLHSLKPLILDRIASHIHQALHSTSPPRPLILVHGAGSFGHAECRRYNVAHGGCTPPQLAAARAVVQRLNLHVISALTAHDIPALALPGLPLWQTSDRDTITRAPLAEIEHMLRGGYVPVLHGDVVWDDVRGCTVLSGDAMVAHLAKAFSARRVVFLSDVPGVFDRPPGEEGATLMRRIDVGAKGEMAGEVVTTTRASDVTGGIRAKMEACMGIVESGGAAEVVIAEGGSDGGLAVLLGGDIGEAVDCTRFR